MEDNPNVYAVYGEIENQLGNHLYGYVASKNSKKAKEIAEEVFHKGRNSSFFDRKFSAEKVEVKGFKVSAQKLEQEVDSK